MSHSLNRLFYFVKTPLSLAIALCLPATAMAEEVVNMGELVVTAQRGNTSLKDSAQKVMVIGRQAIQEQLLVNGDTSQALSKLIPGYGPASGQMSTNGENLRGRSALYLIDGVPQSNPMRDGKREARTIDLSMVEKIEVIYGASAEQGLGATGGIINFITKSAKQDGINHELAVSANASQSLQADGVGGDVRYQLSAVKDNTDVMAAVKVGKTGLYYEADNRRMGMSGNDVMNSQDYDVFAKVAHQLSDEARITASVNHFTLKGKQNYKNIKGNRATGRTDTSVKSDDTLPAIFNKVTTLNTTYQHNNVMGSELSVQAYYQDFAARYRAIAAANFQDPAIAPIGKLVDQSQNNSKKLGAKIGLNTRGLLGGKVNTTLGADVLHDNTQQVLVLTGRDWTPKMVLTSAAVFGQATYEPSDKFSVNAGIRYEMGDIDVKDYKTLAATTRNHKDTALKYTPMPVKGGVIHYKKPLVNVGVVYDLTENTQLFGSYAQGLTIPDIGRTLRGISRAGERVDSLKLDPVVTDSSEIGIRHQGKRLVFFASGFLSKSDFGAVMQYDPVISSYRVERQKTAIKGGEISADFHLNNQTSLSAAYTHLFGRAENKDGSWSDMGARDITPNKLALGLSHKLDGRTTSLTAQHYFTKTYPDIVENVAGKPLAMPSKTNGYTLLDFAYSQPLGKGRVGFGVSNLLNTEYKPHLTQAIAVNTENYNGGRGRHYTLSYQMRF